LTTLFGHLRVGDTFCGCESGPVMRKTSLVGADETAMIGQAVVDGSETSPEYAYGPRRPVILVAKATQENTT
jgi:hypothetical protein